MKIDEKDILKMLADPSTVRKGFERIVRQYSEPLYWKIRHFVMYHEDADDILQNVFLKAWNSLDTFKGQSKLSTWLFRIAINESLDFLRKQKTTAAGDDDMTQASHLMADDYFDGDEVQALLQEAVATLPEVQRAVFCLRYYDEMKYAEMSKLLDKSEGSLKASYHIAVQKVSEYIKSRN